MFKLFFCLLTVCKLGLRNVLRHEYILPSEYYLKFLNYNIKFVSNKWLSSLMALWLAGIGFKSLDLSMRTEWEGVLSGAVSVSDSLILCQRNQPNIRLRCLHQLFVGAYKISKLSFIGQYCSIDSEQNDGSCLRTDLVFVWNRGVSILSKIYLLYF